VPDELLAGHRVLALGETLEMFLVDLTAQSPLLGQSSLPLAGNLVCLGVVVLAGRYKTLRRGTRLGLACAKGIGDGQHGRVGLLEIPLLPQSPSAQFVLAVLLPFGMRDFSIHTVFSAAVVTALDGSSGLTSMGL
jgi:hypothetical protein